MTKCIHCNKEIHPKRLEILPNAKTCVACSTTQRKGGLTVMKGTGDHTWIETYAVEREDYDKMMELEKNYKKQVDPKDKPSMRSTDEDDIIPTIDDFDVDLEEEEEE